MLKAKKQMKAISAMWQVDERYMQGQRFSLHSSSDTVAVKSQLDPLVRECDTWVFVSHV